VNNKLILSFILPLMLFTSCNGNKGKSNGELYKKHLQSLAEGPYVSYNANNYDYDLTFNKTRTTDNSANIYTVLISYKTKRINGIKAIMLPYENISNYTSVNLASVGYTKEMNLTSVHEKDTNNYSQYKLQMEKKNEQLKIYLSISYGDVQDKFELKF